MRSQWYDLVVIVEHLEHIDDNRVFMACTLDHVPCTLDHGSLLNIDHGSGSFLVRYIFLVIWHRKQVVPIFDLIERKVLPLGNDLRQENIVFYPVLIFCQAIWHPFGESISQLKESFLPHGLYQWDHIFYLDRFVWVVDTFPLESIFYLHGRGSRIYNYHHELLVV